MPELPEVETVCRGLRPHLINRRITGVHAAIATLRTPVPLDLEDQCAGKCITAVRRRGKYILVTLDHDKTLLLHLGMTGSCRICTPDEPLLKHEHLTWTLDNNSSWRFSDIRRFGSVQVCNTQTDADLPCLQHLGPEPLGNAFTPAYLYGVSRNSARPVKNLIMDQEVVVGIGNIYAAEALFLAGIRPQKASRRLRQRDCKRLVEVARDVLRHAIKIGGTTISDYRQVDGSEGNFHLQLNVYGKTGQPCLHCGHTIKKLVQAGRSSFYCPNCQK